MLSLEQHCCVRKKTIFATSLGCDGGPDGTRGCSAQTVFRATSPFTIPWHSAASDCVENPRMCHGHHISRQESHNDWSIVDQSRRRWPKIDPWLYHEIQVLSFLLRCLMFSLDRALSNPFLSGVRCMICLSCRNRFSRFLARLYLVTVHIYDTLHFAFYARF